MAVPFFDLTRQYAALRDELDAALRPVLDSQYFILGPQVADFEERMAVRFELGAAIGVASGTDALLLPLRALELEPGDEVIVPSFTFFATAGAVWNAGLRPVFCDVDPETFNVTAESVRAAWTPRTRAVIVVHLFGQMAPVEEIMLLAAERGAAVIEDVAQALGATRTIDGVERQAGSVADVGAFSFFPTKNLGGFGDAGMVSSNDPEIARKVELLRVHGGKKMYHHQMVGTNSRIDTLQAAVLLAKLRRLEGWLAARHANAVRYREALAGVRGLVLPSLAPGNTHSYNQFTVRAERRDELRAFLSGREIGTGLYYPLSLHLQECFAELGYGTGDFPVSERLTEEVVSLPIFPELTSAEVDEVCAGIREFYGS